MFRHLMQKLFGRCAPEEPDGESAPDTADFLRRAPVLDCSQRIAGYAFSLDRPEAPTGRQWQAASQRFFDASLLDHLAATDLAPFIGRRLAFIGLVPESLDLPQLARLPAARMVLSLDDPVAPNLPGAVARIDAVRGLKSRGFRFALPYAVVQGEPSPLTSLADFIVVAANRLSPPELLMAIQYCQRHFGQARMLASGVDSLELFEVCRRLGFDYVRGYYITQRREEEVPTLSSQRLVVTQLISQLKRKDADFDKLAMIARQDLALSVRLLRYINSAAMGLRQKVGSLEQAMTILGHEGLYRWLTLLLFYDSKTSRVDEALRETALARARFCELLARQRLSKAECEQAFVTGLLSIVDVLFGMPMTKAVSYLGLPEEITLALTEHRGKFGPYLALALACERADVRAMASLAAACGIHPGKVNALHLETLAWAVEYDGRLESDAP